MHISSKYVSAACSCKNCFPYTRGAICSSSLFYFLQLMQIMIKVSDVSNEARPMEVAEPWLDCLLQEFFIQVSVQGHVVVFQ